MKRGIVALVLMAILSAAVQAAEPPAKSTQAVADAIKTLAGATWITGPAAAEEGAAVAGRLHFRHAIAIPYESKDAGCVLWVAARGSRVRVFLNGFFLADEVSPGGKVYLFNQLSYLNPGRNALALEVDAEGTEPPAMAVVMRISNRQSVPSGADWRVSGRESAGWRTQFFDDESWPKAMDFAGATPVPTELVRLPRPMIWPVDERPPHMGENVLTTDPWLKLWPAGPKKLPLGGEQAQALLEADWIFQASGKPTPARSLAEIGWARDLAGRLKRAAPGLDLSKDLAQLADLEKQLRALTAGAETEEARALYLAVRRVKRQMTFRNPVLDFDRILCLDGGLTAGHESGSHGAGGRHLLLLESLSPGAPVQVLAQGGINRYDLGFDARRIVYGNGGKLFELNLDAQGRPDGRPRQLTNSKYMDVEPIYLPDGHILFRTTRAQSMVRCHDGHLTAVLARCDGDGKNIYIISHNSEPDFTPCLLLDGRVIYTRWEYTERPLWRLQKLWTMNPDGTGIAHYWGNRSLYVDVAWEARPIPGTRRVMFVGSGHHDMRPGCIGVLDANLGRDWPDGIWKVTLECEWPESGDEVAGDDPYAPRPRPGLEHYKRPEKTSDRPYAPDYHVSGPFLQYRSPYPLGPEDFLVSASRVPASDAGLYLMDIHGNKELLFRGPSHIWCAMPLRPRPKPPVIPDRVAWPKAGEKPSPGALFSPNVYDRSGIPAGKVKYLRVVELMPKTYTLGGHRLPVHTGPAISLVQSDLTKRFLGTAPVAPDGSVCFQVPPGKAVCFQLLDEQYRCLQVMRSFTGVMPGEMRGCTGCHEQKDQTPYSPASGNYRTPVALTPPPWGMETIGYERFCQPVLDTYCGKCHQGNGEARSKLDLTLRGGMAEAGFAPEHLPYKDPYTLLLGVAGYTMHRHGQIGAGIAGAYPVEKVRIFSMNTQSPMVYLSYASPLVTLATSGKHHGVKVGGEDLLRLMAWVDSNCVYRGMEEVRRLPETGPLHLTRSAPEVDRLCPVNDPSPDVVVKRK
jgi:hypothetical protein